MKNKLEIKYKVTNNILTIVTRIDEKTLNLHFPSFKTPKQLQKFVERFPAYYDFSKYRLYKQKIQLPKKYTLDLVEGIVLLYRKGLENIIRDGENKKEIRILKIIPNGKEFEDKTKVLRIKLKMKRETEIPLLEHHVAVLKDAGYNPIFAEYFCLIDEHLWRKIIRTNIRLPRFTKFDKGLMKSNTIYWSYHHEENLKTIAEKLYNVCREYENKIIEALK